jgi:putative membrane protein
MIKASTFFTESERGSIKAAVAAAASRTAGEIVPVVATESGDYDREEHLAGSSSPCSSLHGLGERPGRRGGRLVGDGHGGGARLLPVLLLLSLSYAVGTGWRRASGSGRSSPGRLPRAQRRRRRRARVPLQRLASTKGATGVMIYVSLFERRVRVLGDDAIAERITTTTGRRCATSRSRASATGTPPTASAPRSGNAATCSPRTSRGRPTTQSLVRQELLVALGVVRMSLAGVQVIASQMSVDRSPTPLEALFATRRRLPRFTFAPESVM